MSYMASSTAGLSHRAHVAAGAVRSTKNTRVRSHRRISLRRSSKFQPFTIDASTKPHIKMASENGRAAIRRGVGHGRHAPAQITVTHASVATVTRTPTSTGHD
jgi:hypothetical protein